LDAVGWWYVIKAYLGRGGGWVGPGRDWGKPAETCGNSRLPIFARGKPKWLQSDVEKTGKDENSG
jgi:hypothetical protein